ncbi:MAG: SurA N-terminal domain-containing protein [Burkholderiaceae bacterium]|jgi:peptidyl-prolyl cis-trans isomerase D|nr:SurA N-terminal domain-containing protein [Burkholderiaceae bacterium]
MFEFVRTHTKLLLFVLVLLIIPSFVFFGVQGYSQFNDPANRTVVTVGGRKITQNEWDAAHQRQIEQARRQMPGIDARLLDSPEFKRETLEGLVRDEVLRRTAQDLHLATTDERLQRTFVSDPQLAFLRQADGRVNRDILAAQGMSVDQFEARLRADLTLRQVIEGVAATGLAPRAPAKQALDALLERRDVQLQLFAARDYAARVEPTDDDLAAYYNDPANQPQFMAPEQAKIEYVVLDQQAIARRIPVSEDDLRRYYEENAARFTQAEERRASHILVTADKDAPAADRAAAKAKAEALLADVRANPASFADVARKNSDDPGSAAAGGDLDFFGRGAMVKPFEDAVFAMKPGEISPVVETDFGYHIIRLDAVRGGERRPFDSVRAELADEVRRQQAQRQYAEAAEQFTNTVYEQADSLQPVADKLGLAVQTATVQRAPAPGASGALASAALLEAVFGSDALRNKRNTEAIEVGAGQLVSARVVQHEPQHLRPLDEVKDQVRARVVASKAAALARQDGQARLQALKDGGDTAALPAALTLSRAEPQGLPPAVVDAVLRADASALPSVFGVDLGAQGYAVVRLTQVRAPEPTSPQFAQLEPRVAQAWADAEARAYYDALKKRLKVTMPAAPAPAAP